VAINALLVSITKLHIRLRRENSRNENIPAHFNADYSLLGYNSVRSDGSLQTLGR
jgi:hypothetical protein